MESHKPPFSGLGSSHDLLMRVAPTVLKDSLVVFTSQRKEKT
jgi:hypothetical protein